MKKKIEYGSIIKKEKLKFKTEEDLEKYYYNKYKKEGGYKKRGFKIFGINLSNIYHKNRLNLSFEFLEPQKNEVILDAGCGTGELTKRIAKKCKKIFGVDIAKNAISLAKKNAPKNCRFEYGNIEKLRFPNKYFDKIVSVETLEHILKPKIALKEFNRVLKTRGKLVLCIPTLDHTIRAKIERFFRIAESWPISEHLHEWDFDNIKYLTEKQGFNYVKAKGLVFDWGILERLQELSKTFCLLMINLKLSIKSFPRNSLWVVMLFEKIE